MPTHLSELEDDVITRGHLEKGLDSLREEFAGIFSAETIEPFMAESLGALKDSRLKDFVPLFVRRFARERLRAPSPLEGTIAKTVREVPFVCEQKAGRSQIAAALLDQYARVASTSARLAATPPTGSRPLSCRRWPSSGSTSARSSQAR